MKEMTFSHSKKRLTEDKVNEDKLLKIGTGWKHGKTYGVTLG